MRWRAALWCVCLGTLASCGSSPGAASLIVDVSTDFVPAREFSLVRVEVVSNEVELHRAEVPAQRQDDFLGGRTVGDFEQVTIGDYDLVVSLLTNAGSVAAQRRIPLRVEGFTEIEITLSRRCAGIACPGGACHAGVCVAPDCLHECGPPECTHDADCGVASACTRVLCTSDGQCMVTPDDSLCGADEICDQERGCRWADLSRCHPSDCDDNNPCTEERCQTGTCVNVPVDAPCDDGLFCNGPDRCANGTCSVHQEPPCMSVCSEATRSCNPCMRNEDCGAVVEGDWGECNYANACATEAEQMRSIMQPTCNSGFCSVIERIERQMCNRETDGSSCGTTNPAGDWSECAFENECAVEGTQTRQVMGEICMNGTCQMQAGEEMRTCPDEPRAREHMECGAGGHFRCCSGECRDTTNDNSHCGGCNLACSSGLTCAAFEHDGATRGSCNGCNANTQCPPSNATCWVRSGSTGRCQCQSDSNCTEGQSCFDGTGDNYCFYSGPI